MSAEDAEESVYIIMWFLVMVLWSMIDDDSVEHKLCLSLFQAAEDDVAPCSHIAKFYCKKQNPSVQIHPEYKSFQEDKQQQVHSRVVLRV